MTSDGSAYSRFRRALNTGNLALVMTSAKELPRIGLDDALRICLIMRDARPDSYDRAAVRWLGRFALEGRDVTVADLRSASQLLAELPHDREAALKRLDGLCRRHGVAR